MKGFFTYRSGGFTVSSCGPQHLRVALKELKTLDSNHNIIYGKAISG